MNRLFPNVALLAALAVTPWTARAAPAGEAAAFDGYFDRVQVEMEPGHRDLDAFSVAVWVKLNHTGGIQTFLNRGERGQLFTLYLYQDHVRMLVEHGEGRYSHASTKPPPAGEWVHYAGSYDGRTIRLYVDGDLVDSTEAPGRMPVRNHPLFIGATSVGQNVVDGELADVRLYNEALPAALIREIAAGREPVAPGPVLHLTGGQLAERKASGFDMTEDGEPSFPFARGKLPTTDGFRGIWYLNGPSPDGLHKYSGGLGTYPQQHIPIAVYAKEVNKTFFTYGGTRKDRNQLLHMVSAYDHETGKVARPRILLDKVTTDAHDNPTMAIDSEGYIWIFSNAHGTGRPSYIHRSSEPYSIDSFELQVKTNFSYSQPWYLSEHKFVFLHTLYSRGRGLFVANSADGIHWSDPRDLAHVARGHYQISWPRGNTIGTAFNYHPNDGSPLGSGLNHRTNLYYLESDDGGYTWRNVRGEVIDLPLREPDNPALAIEYESKLRICYLKDLQYTKEGHPVILHLLAPTWRSGPTDPARQFVLARWTGSEWKTSVVTDADNNYDFASLYIETDGTWRIIGTTEPGPQEYNTGGEMAVWISRDQGETWRMVQQVTRDSEYNHTYPRRPLNAHPDFYALWADGSGRELSPSRLYFMTRDGDAFQLPPVIEGDAEWVDPIPLREATAASGE